MNKIFPPPLSEHISIEVRLFEILQNLKKEILMQP